MREISPMLQVKKLEETCECGKVIYVSFKGAQIVARSMGKKVHAYPCRIHKNNFHVGHTK